MKLVFSQSQFNGNLSLVSRAVSSRPSHPVLANVLMVADESAQQVSLSAFDLSLGIQTSFPAQIEDGGSLTLPAKLLSDIISRLPDGDITLTTEDDESGLVTLTSSTGRYQVRSLPADEFPSLPTVEDGQTANLPIESLLAGLRGTLFATSDDEAKQILTGVHLTIRVDGLEFAATDGHRLSVVKTASEEEVKTEEVSVTIPAKALQELIKMLERQSGAVTVIFDSSQAVFEWTDQRLTTRLLEGQYPNYPQLLPKKFDHMMTVNRKAILASLDRIAVLADQRNSIVKLNLDTSKLLPELALSVDAQDVGSGNETINAQITGEGLEFAANVKYLMEGLKAIPTDDIELKANTPTSPVILAPVGGVKMTYLVMPVQIRNDGKPEK